MSNDSLGDRMKGYEETTRYTLMRRSPVIIRLDGRAFHTFTKGLKYVDETLEDTPFSTVMHTCMYLTTRALINGIQNAVIAYSQSDEITILLRDWDKHETEQWFDGNIQKIVSISASIASVAFSNAFSQYKDMAYNSLSYSQVIGDFTKGFLIQPTLVQFDSRVFNIPEAEVVNNFIWRQQDASRNSVQMLARHYFSHKELHKKNNGEIQDMLMLQKGVNWNNIPTWQKRGFCVSREGVDREIPVFTQDRDYIGKFLRTPEEV